VRNFVSLSRWLATSYLAAATFFSGLSVLPSQSRGDEPALTIGSTAPEIDIEHWVSDNDGAFEHVTELKSGKVYVIEFWATWCGPCIASMPHLSEIQEKFADQGVQIISVSDEKLEQVESFLEKNVRGKDDQTYAELTNNYCLTVDPDRSVHKDYFAAAGQRGIPCAFIVGKTGKIEWIGHPMRMDSPLQQVVDDEWDRDAFLVEYKAQKKREAQQMLLMGLARSVGQKAKAGKFDEAIEAIDDALENEKFDFATAQLESMREQVLKLQEEQEKADAEKAAAEKAAAEKAAAEKADAEKAAAEKSAGETDNADDE